MMTKVSWLCLFLAVVMLVWAGLCMIRSGDSRQAGDALIVENQEQDLGEQTLGDHTLEVRVRNNSGQPRRILGMAGQ